MKTVAIISVLFLSLSCSTAYKVVEQPTDYSSVIEKGRVTGVIFKENAACFMCLQDTQRLTPTVEDIEKDENILRENLKTVNQSRMNQVGNCPIIHENLKFYRRQYFGYIDSSGNRIIY